MKNYKIEHNDSYNIFDKMSNFGRKLPNECKSGPLGWVRMYIQKKEDEKRKLVFEGSNMVVAQGRYFVAQRIFNVPDLGIDYRNHIISHFSVGAGGASVTNENVTLLGPHVCDTHLYKPISLNSTHNEPGNYDNTGLPDLQKPIFNSFGAVKPIDKLTLVDEDFEESGVSCSYKTKMKCECIVGAGEPPMLSVNGYVPISEAGLYFTNANDVKMFAHICFPPKFKELESILTIDWYILC